MVSCWHLWFIFEIETCMVTKKDTNKEKQALI